MYGWFDSNNFSWVDSVVLSASNPLLQLLITATAGVSYAANASETASVSAAATDLNLIDSSSTVG